MSEVTVCVDPGSTHCGRLEYAFESISLAKDCGADYVKFQLFEPGSPIAEKNPVLPWIWWDQLWTHSQRVGMPITASVFDLGSLDRLVHYAIPFLKFAHSIGYREDWVEFAGKYIQTRPKIVVTTDFMGVNKIPEWCIKLYTVTTNGKPDYPAEKEIACWKDIEGQFDGFSCHFPPMAAIEQCRRAVAFNLSWLEVHMMPDKADITCPDAAFSLKPKELKELIKAVKK